MPKYIHPKLEPILAETYGIACLRAGTPVWYADGTMKPIENVQRGDEILTFDQGVVRPGRAAKVWPSGKKKLLRITLSTGTVIECSEDHRFPTPAGDVMARDLRVNQAYKRRSAYLYTEPKSMLFEAWSMPCTQPGWEIGEDRAYLLGMLIGDGHLVGTSPEVALRHKGERGRGGATLSRGLRCAHDSVFQYSMLVRTAGVQYQPQADTSYALARRDLWRPCMEDQVG